MRVRAISWVGVKTDMYQPMRDLFAEVAGLAIDYERPDFTVFRFPSGDKLEVFGPTAGDPPEQFARNQVVASLLVDDIDEAVQELRAAGIELIGGTQAGGNGYFWQHFRAPDGKVLELVCDPLHPSSEVGKRSAVETGPPSRFLPLLSCRAPTSRVAYDRARVCDR